MPRDWFRETHTFCSTNQALRTFPALFFKRAYHSLAPTSDWLVTLFTVTLIGSISTHLYST